ncbi:MAG: GspE/PulE/PilB domain-containing protein, partial [Planctomycetota bacterium]
MNDAHATSGQLDGQTLNELTAPGAGDGATTRERCTALGIDWLEQAPPADADAVSLITADAAVRLRVVPLRHENGRLLVAMIDPLDIAAMDEV